MNRFLLPLLLVFVGCAGSDERPGSSDAAVASAVVEAKAEAARVRLDASEGGRIVLRAIEAQGGLEAWYAAPTSSYAWEYANTGANTRFKTYMVVDNSSRRAYHTILEQGTPDASGPATGRFAWDGSQAWISPASLSGPNPRFWSLTGYYFQSIPFVLADPGLHYEVLPDAPLDGIPHDMVRVSFSAGVGDSPGDTYTLYVSKDTGRVAAIRYTVTYGQTLEEARQATPPETLFYYLDHETVDGLTVPTRFEGYRVTNGEKGAKRSEAYVSDISFRRPFDESQLEMPDDARVQSMPADD